jgi:nicotinamidase-related amidase
MVVLIGLTLDCCVLCTAQEFLFRGYDVRVLKEGVDTYGGTAEEKEILLGSVV